MTFGNFIPIRSVTTLIFFVTNDWFPKRAHHSLAQTIITWSHKSRFTDLLSPTPCARQSISFLSLHTVTSPMFLCKVFPGKHILTRGWLYYLFLSHQGKIDNGWWDVAIAKKGGNLFCAAGAKCNIFHIFSGFVFGWCRCSYYHSRKKWRDFFCMRLGQMA